MEWHDTTGGSIVFLDGHVVGDALADGRWYVHGVGSGQASRPTLEAAKAEAEAAVWARLGAGLAGHGGSVGSAGASGRDF